MASEASGRRVAEVVKITELKEMDPDLVPPLMLKFEHNPSLTVPAETLEYVASVVEHPVKMAPRRSLSGLQLLTGKPLVRRAVKCCDPDNPGTTYSPIVSSVHEESGSNMASLACNPKRRRFLAVRNKRENTVELIEIESFVLSPDLWRERGVGVTIHDDARDGDAEKRASEGEEIDERQKKLLMAEKTVMEFGSKRKQRSLVSSKRGARGTLSAVDMEDVSTLVAEADVHRDPEETVTDVNGHITDLFPIANREAGDVAQVYDWDSVIGEQLIEKLRATLPDELKAESVGVMSSAKISQLYKTSPIPPTNHAVERMAGACRACAATAKTEAGRARREVMLCGALFFDLLIFMVKSRNVSASDTCRWPSHATPEVRQDMLDFFCERGKKNFGEKFIKNVAAETKMLAYLIVVEFLFKDFKFPLRDLSMVTGIKPMRLRSIVTGTGGRVLAIGKQDVAVLKLPLVDPSELTKARPAGKGRR